MVSERFFFFFSSRRRHTRLQGDWSSDVCSPISISGPFKARAPLAGVRFRRDTKKAGSVGLEIDYAPLEVTGSCTNPGCEPNAVLFAPAYEPGLRPAWG